ncbi:MULTISPECIES: LCP family protein [unclassified Corynebacterium]|uniref:LCP family protein n=1 Tax=unclassified Corynebacterium TaxID=2624378 RepID=UPI0029C9B910|nr:MULTISPECIES: LCP family protein [unclassified Corynebacterium]WPF66628.1 LCP family protein [Corynebacterium sp. 22KM0430]WPF69116.1 LCP family protein [Corynebacterium sp. 21KM1197]
MTKHSWPQPSSSSSSRASSPRPSRNIQAPPRTRINLAQAGSRPVKTTLAVLSALVLLISALGYFAVGRLGSQLASAGNLHLGGNTSKGSAPDGATDILLVGSDSRTDAQGKPLSREELDALRAGVEDGAYNTDTIMLIRVPNDGTSATAVSIPRDTYIHDDSYGNLKINGVFSSYKTAEEDELRAEGMTDEKRIDKQSTEAGRAGLISAVSDLTGIEVDHYAEVGLLGFVLLTDAVGGVEVCLNEAVNDEFSGANFHAGRQTLDGHQALAFVRQRHGLPRGDLDRVVRQQAFMASMVNKVLSAGTLTNPARLGDMSQAVERSVVLDESMDIMSFATQLSNLAGGNVVFNTIPVTSIDGVGDYGESIVTVDPPQVHAFMRTLLGEDDPDSAGHATDEPDTSEADSSDSSAPEHPATLTVLNAGTIAGLAGSVSSYLTSAGYTVAETTNAVPGVYTTSQIVAPHTEDEAALELSRKLGDMPIVVNETLSPGTLIVVTAEDYAGPRDDSADSADSTEATPSTGATTQATAPREEDAVGQPGADFGTAEVAPEIDAGGTGPRCVN